MSTIDGLNFPNDDSDLSPESIYKRHLAACAEVRRLAALAKLGGTDDTRDLDRAIAIHDETRKALIDHVNATPRGERTPDIALSADAEADESTHAVGYVGGIFIAHVFFGDSYLVAFDPTPALDLAGFKIVPK
jgi:hypothetical protein